MIDPDDPATIDDVLANAAALTRNPHRLRAYEAARRALFRPAPNSSEKSINDGPILQRAIDLKMAGAAPTLRAAIITALAESGTPMAKMKTPLRRIQRKMRQARIAGSSAEPNVSSTFCDHATPDLHRIRNNARNSITRSKP